MKGYEYFMETKYFFEVFPTIETDGDIRDLFENVAVTKVARNRANNAVRVYILSNRLIEKKTIRKIESVIKEQIFEDSSVKVNIIEKFSLSGQYTPERLYKIYRDSILYELKDYSVIIYHMLKRADYSFKDDKIMNLTIQDSTINRAKESELTRILEKIFWERCGLPVEVIIDYKNDEQGFAAGRKKKIELEVAAIIENASAGMEEDEKQDLAEKQEEKKVPEKKQAAELPQKTDSKREDTKKAYRSYRKENNPDVLYGRDFDDEEEIVAIASIGEEVGETAIRGQIIELDKREIRGEKTIVMFDVTDFTDSITVKMFTKNEFLDDILAVIKKGAFIKIKGVITVDRYDGELTMASIIGIKKCSDFRTKRMDTSVEKRVELHCHTKMSDMDGVTSAKDLIKRAISWGHKALAITDHGLVQGFPEAFHALRDIEGKYNWEPFDFKIIYGVEAYLVDDIKNVVTNSMGQRLDGDFVVFDLETTGFSALNNRIIEIGAVKVSGGQIKERFSTFVNPKEPIPFRIEKLTGINDSMVIDARTIEEILPEFLEFSKDCVMVAHNADFDMSFIMRNCERMGIEKKFTILDTVNLARILMPGLKNFKLDTVAKALGVSLLNHHRAVDDAECTAGIFLKLIEMLNQKGIFDLDAVNDMGISDAGTIMKMPTHHAIILATGEVGRVNLYHLVSDSHIKYFHRFPRIPKSDFLKYREGLLIGSACEAGELYQAVLEGKSDEEIARLTQFYDYLEIQPLGNNEFMINSEKSSVSSKEELIEINKKIVKLGEEFNKPVVATCDVHFMDPEDEVYRRIIMAGKGFKDADDQAPLYYMRL